GLDLAPDQLVEGRPAGQALQERGEAVEPRPVPFGPDRDGFGLQRRAGIGLRRPRLGGPGRRGVLAGGGAGAGGQGQRGAEGYKTGAGPTVVLLQDRSSLVSWVRRHGRPGRFSWR